MQTRFEGGCLCGAVRYLLTATPNYVYFCHCRDCQRFASGPYAVGVIVLRADFSLTGSVSSTDRVAESGRIVHQFACAVCGCRIWHEAGNTPDTIIARAGTLDDPAHATGTEEEKLAVFRRVRDEIRRVFTAYADGRRDQLKARK